MVSLLGGFRVEIDGHPVPADAWRHRRGADLVKLLALAPLHRMHREQAMARLWPELGSEAAAANLRKAVHFARRALGDRTAIAVEDDLLVLWPAGGVRVDALEVESEAVTALAGGQGHDAALERFKGDLLPEDPYAGWIEPHRERLRSRRIELLRAAGRWDEVLEVDRTDEEACRALMRASLEHGNRQGAIRQFQRLREILRVDLGVSPEPATVAMFEQAIAIGGPEPSSPVEKAQALLARGLLHWNERDLDGAQQAAQAARVLAVEHRLGRELGEASALLGMVAMATGQWPQVFSEHVAAAVQQGDEMEPFVLDAHLCLIEASLAGVDSESNGRLARGLLDLAIDSRSAPGEALMSLLIGESELFSGRMDESHEWLTRALGLYEEIDGASGRAVALLRLGEVAAARDQRAEARRRLAAARQHIEQSPLASHLRPRALEVMIKTADGPARSQPVLVEAESLLLHPREVCRPCSIGLRVAAAIACARAGDLPRSRHWLEGAERLAGVWSVSSWQAAVWEARAALRQAEGDPTQAAALLREAGNLFARCGRPVDQARCLAASAAAS